MSFICFIFKLPQICPRNSQKFLASFQILQPFRKNYWCSLSWNSQEFQVLLAINLNFWEFLGFQNQNCYSLEFLGILKISKSLLAKKLGISGNFQVFRARMATVWNSQNSQEFSVRIYCENSHLLFLGIPRNSQEFPGIPRNSQEFLGIPTQEFLGIPSPVG